MTPATTLAATPPSAFTLTRACLTRGCVTLALMLALSRTGTFVLPLALTWRVARVQTCDSTRGCVTVGGGVAGVTAGAIAGRGAGHGAAYA